MKRQILLFSLLAMGLASCENGTNTTTTSDTSAMAPAADPNMITTTTTTTTTRPAFQPKPDVKYMDLRTHKLITVRVDTVNHYIVNTVTNQPVEFIVEPGTTDTFYGPNLQMANGAINYGNNGSTMTYDETRASSSTSTTDMSNAAPPASSANASNGASMTNTEGTEGKTKVKEKRHETKVKTK